MNHVDTTAAPEGFHGKDSATTPDVEVRRPPTKTRPPRFQFPNLAFA